MLCIVLPDVFPDDIFGYRTNRPVEITPAPKMSAEICLSEIRMGTEHFIRTCTFQQADCFRWAHCLRQYCNHMYVILHDSQFYYRYSVSFCNGSYYLLAVHIMGFLFQGLIPVFCAPLQVHFVYSDRMRAVRKVIIFIVHTIHMVHVSAA